MKNAFNLLFLFLGFSLMAQQNTITDFVVLTPKIQQLQPILLTAQEVESKGDFQVILYGKEVTQLTDPKVRKFIKWAQKVGVKLSVCNMSLEKLKIDPASIPKEIGIVDNAFLSAFQLQKKGYKILSL